MFGPPEDVKGECNARLYLGDDYGDNVCTVRCPLPENHKLPHQEEFKRGGMPVLITWHVDEEENTDEKTV
jgi:hypothetical protein